MFELKRLPTSFLRGLLVAALLASSFVSWQGSAQARSSEEITQDINELAQQEASLDAKIEDLERKIDAKRSEISSLNNQVALLQQEVDQLELQIESTETKIDKTNAEIERTTIEIRATEERIAGAKQQLGALIRLLAQLDDTNPFEIVIANKNFSELLDQVQYTEKIQEQTQGRLDEIQKLRAELDVQKHNLEIQLRQAQDLKAQLEGQQAAVVEKKDEKDNLLDKTRGEEANYQKLQKETKQLQAEVQKEIDTLQAELASSSGFSGTPPPLGSGIFIKPVDGVITQGFGMTDYAKGGAYGGSPHEGIDFSGPLGSPIFAAADGVVVAKGDLGAAAYGRWIVLRHDQYGVYTLYGHLLNVPSVSVGSSVKQGQIIANEGSTGYSSGPHVHFGVGLNFKTYSKSYGLLPVANWVNPAPYLE